MIQLDDAACRDVDPELFLPAPHDLPAIEVARQICKHCPVRLDCLALALNTPHAQGIWGGLTQHERAAHQQHHDITIDVA